MLCPCMCPGCRPSPRACGQPSRRDMMGQGLGPLHWCSQCEWPAFLCNAAPRAAAVGACSCVQVVWHSALPLRHTSCPHGTAHQGVAGAGPRCATPQDPTRALCCMRHSCRTDGGPATQVEVTTRCAIPTVTGMLAISFIHTQPRERRAACFTHLSLVTGVCTNPSVHRCCQTIPITCVISVLPPSWTGLSRLTQRRVPR